MSEKPQTPGLFEDLKPHAPDSPKGKEFLEILNTLEGGSEENMPDELGPDFVKELLAAITRNSKEASIPRLRAIMEKRGYVLDETDPDHLVLKRKK